MRKLLVAAVLALFALPATPAFAVDVTEPNAIQGSLTENYRGTKVTVGYAACGATFAVGWDPYAQYLAIIKKGGRGFTTTIWAHDITDLAATLGRFGYSLTQDQIGLLVQLRADYACTL
jgi:hypothetical protein